MKVHVIPSEWLEQRKLDAIKNLKYQNSDLLHQIQQSFPATEQPTAIELAKSIECTTTTAKANLIEAIETLNKAGFIIVKK